MTKRVVKVALLICDTPVDDVVRDFGNYYDIYKRWLLESLETYPDQAISSSINFIIDGYNVVDQEYPEWNRLQYGVEEAYDCVMITGSKHTAHDTSNPFIPPLIEFVHRIINSPNTLHIKLIGICFGHQILSIALGGKCESGNNGWEIGVYGCKLTAEGKYWWTGDVEDQGGEDIVYVQQMHKDHVPFVPPGCILLAKSDKYPVHSVLKLHPASTQSNPLAQVLTIQGHPEYTPSIVHHVINSRAASGVFDNITVQEARRRAGGRHGTGGEGFGRIGWAIWRVMLQNAPPA
ncbi:hypothetical protein L204_104619 [Cryptococcus depauperatus]|nr:cytoplasmic protein [Cryptococcus depauperatus CBS 7855]